MKKQYEVEARERWGGTEAYREYDKRQTDIRRKSGQMQTMA